MNVDVKRFKNITTNDRYISSEKKYKIESKGSFEFGWINMSITDVFKEEKWNQPRVSDIGLASLTKCLNTSLM